MIRYKFWFLLLFIIAGKSFAQNLELVENKGQWDAHVKLKGAMNNGAFFLQSQGYKVVQHNEEDLDAVSSYNHGHAHKNHTDAAKSIKGGKPENNVVVLHSHAYEVLFSGSNTTPQIIMEKPQPGYNNYFTGDDPSKWGTNCKIYNAVTYKNMYPGVDVRYYSSDGRLKYDIIVQPNADISKLALQYIGVDGLEVKNGDLYVKTSVGDIKELYPYTYQLQQGQRTAIECKYKVSGNTVRFQLGNYNRSSVLVIDPTLAFSTFTGSTSDNWGYTATYGPGGVAYGGGIVFGTGYPTSNGAFQTTFNGGENEGSGVSGYDIGIIKLNSNGTQRLYATYIGGNKNEAPHSMITDAQGNLFVAGRTRSLDFPKRGTGVIGTNGGDDDWDVVVFKLNVTGNTLIGSLRIGGSSNDGVNIRNKYPNPNRESLMQNYGDDSRSEIILDGSGGVLVASSSQSTNFPVTPNAAQLTKSGFQDALLLKFDINISAMTYATYLGGNLNDAAYVISVSPETGNIFVGGGTESNNFPGNKTGTVGPVFHGTAGTEVNKGDIDGFIAEFSNSGTTLIRSTYIGTVSIDQVYGLKFDRFGFPYIMGTTLGSFPISTNAIFRQTGGKQFIAKLQKDLSSYVYSTVFGSGGSTPNISPIAFLVDRCENVYISGWGGSIGGSGTEFFNSGTSGLSITPDAIKSTTDGKDFYFFVLQKDAVAQLYGSFFGQTSTATADTPDHVDGGTSRFDEDGVIYQGICANCNRNAPFPTTQGVWAPINGSTNCNEAIIKIEFNLAGISAGVKSSIGAVDGDTSGCVPITVNFRDTVALGKSFEWNFGDGSPSVTTTTANTSHTFNTVGVYTVRLIAVDSTKCFPRDTSYVNVYVREDYVPLNAQAVKLPPCQSTTYRFDNLSTPFPGKPFKANSFRWIWGDNSPDVVTGSAPVTHNYPGFGTYNAKLVLEDTNYCNAPDTFFLTVRVSPNVRASTSTPLSGCAPYNAVFTNTSLGGLSFFWDFGDGTTSQEINPVHLYPTPGVYRVKLIAIDSTTCNGIDSAFYNITVSGSPTAAFTYSPNPAQENTISTFTNTSTGAIRYRWYFGDGDSLYTVRQDTVVRHLYNATQQFRPCLVAINQFNCTDTSCQNLDAIVSSLLDVPNAFTPNGDGANDRAVVIGFGITRLTFKIYNRWGQLVFETNDRKLGWNGIYNGKPQPMDVYAYTLEAEYFDGKKERKQGDITLIR
jgi:gliding motility-associated-like protein